MALQVKVFTCFVAISLCLGFSIVFALAEDAVEEVPETPVDFDSLRLVQVIFRHGDRTPVVQYPKDPLQNESLWPEGFSALTKKGKKMHYDLGRYLRKRYSGYLSPAYMPSEIVAQSSSADRAIMSALSNLAGLFPPTKEDPKSIWNEEVKWQPIPVHALTDRDDNFLNFKAYCPRFKQLKEFGIRHSEFAKEINDDPENQKLFHYLSQYTGWDVVDFEQVSDLHDTLLIQHNYNLPLPNWTESVFPEKTGKLFALPFDTRVQVPNREAQKVKGGPLLKRLVTNMDVRRNSNSLTEEVKKSYRKAKMYMYSGHDSTSSILLGMLGVFDTQFPSYASTVMLEMYELPDHQAESTDYFVKVLFRNTTSVPPFELKIPGCGSPCRLDRLKEMYSDVMIDGDEWKKACTASS